jgi:hypothetical protein
MANATIPTRPSNSTASNTGSSVTKAPTPYAGGHKAISGGLATLVAPVEVAPVDNGDQSAAIRTKNVRTVATSGVAVNNTAKIANNPLVLGAKPIAAAPGTTNSTGIQVSVKTTLQAAQLATKESGGFQHEGRDGDD